PCCCSSCCCGDRKGWAAGGWRDERRAQQGGCLMNAVQGVVARAAASPQAAKAPDLLRPALIVAVLVVLGLFVPTVLKSNFYLGLLLISIVLGLAAVSIGFLAHQSGILMFVAAVFSVGATCLVPIPVPRLGWD